jgi:hypothetical protein
MSTRQSVMKPLMQGLAVQPTIDSRGVMILSPPLISRRMSRISSAWRIFWNPRESKAQARRPPSDGLMIVAAASRVSAADNLYTSRIAHAQPEGVAGVVSLSLRSSSNRT